MDKVQLRDSALRAQRMTQEEVMAALRSNGMGDAAEVAAVVFKTDGSLAVIKEAPPDAAKSALNFGRKS